MITLLSRSEAFLTSSCTAVCPPTSASAPSTAWTDSRTATTVSWAAWLSAGSVRVPWR